MNCKETGMKSLSKTFLSLLLGVSLISVSFSFKSQREQKKIVEGYNEVNYLKQVHSAVTMLEYGKDEKQRTNYYKVQKPIDQYLYLGANEVFFYLIGKLKSFGVDKNDPNLELNKGREFYYISKFMREQDQLKWTFITTEEGDFKADSFFEFTEAEAGNDEKSKETVLPSVFREVPTLYIVGPSL